MTTERGKRNYIGEREVTTETGRSYRGRKEVSTEQGP